MKRVYFLVLLLGFSGLIYAQIYEPEGLNMPGSWNGWTNPPTNNMALASFTQVTGGTIFKTVKNESTVWTTTLKVANTGGDLTGGGYEFVFSSGPTGDPYSNTWKNVAVSMNMIQSYTFNGDNNNNIVLTNDKWYVMNWLDAGYQNTSAIFMEVSASPVTITSVEQTGAPDDGNYYASSTDQVIDIEIDKAKTADENIYLRYTTDAWSNSSFVLATGSGTDYSATIPAQSEGTDVIYYVLTTTVDAAVRGDLEDSPDLCTIDYDDNTGSKYTYTVSGPRSASSGNWNSISTWLFGAVPSSTDNVTISSGDNVTLDQAETVASLLIEESATFTASNDPKGNEVLTIADGGTLTNNGSFEAGTGTIVFNGACTLNGSQSITFNHLTLNGGLDINKVPGVNGTLQINGGGSVNATPNYGNSSILKYNTNAAFNQSFEWTSSGAPGEVIIVNTSLTLQNNPAEVGLIDIQSNGTCILNGNTLTVSDGGTLRNNGTFTINNEKVTFAGSGAVEGTTAINFYDLEINGAVTFNHSSTVNNQIQINSGGSVTLGTNLLTIGDGGQIYNNGGTFHDVTSKVVFSGSGSINGSATFNNLEINGGVDFGNSSTINGSLTVFANGSAITNGPTFGGSSKLIFETGGNYEINSGTVLWVAGSNLGQGVPNDVEVTTTSPLKIYAARDVTGNLTIGENGSIDQGNNIFIVQGNLVNDGEYAFVSDGANALTVQGNFTNNGTFALSATGGGDLYAEGDFTDNGTFTHNNRAVFFDGTSPQNIGGTASTIFGYVIVNPAAKVNLNKNITVADNFTVKSDATGTGSLILDGAITGTVNIERFITTGWNWHFLSSPVQNQKITDHFIDFSSGTGETDVDFYRWGETVTGDNRWINIKNNDGSLNESFGTPSTDPEFDEGLGYLVAYADRAGLTKTFSGTPNTGNQTLTHTYTADGGQGWNLAGNPYPSAIDWTLLDKTNLAADYYYVYNQNKAGGAGYEFFKDASNKTDGVNGKIPAMQGFFVQAASGGGSIGLTNADRVHDDQAFLKGGDETDENLLKLKLTAGAYYYTAQFRLNDDASVEGDPNDARMLMSLDQEVPQFYSITPSGTNLALNAMPAPDEEHVIPLGMRLPGSGEYTIQPEDIGDFNILYDVMLEDTQESLILDLRTSGPYSFTANDGGYLNDRFTLHFKSTVGINDLNQKPEIAVSQIGNELRFFNLKPGTYNVRIVDVMGRVVMEQELKSANSFVLSGNLKAGHYLVQLVGKQTYRNGKILIY